MKRTMALNLVKSGSFGFFFGRVSSRIQKFHNLTVFQATSSAKNQVTTEVQADLAEICDYTDLPQYPADVPSIYDDSDKHTAHGRNILREIIRDLPTIEEKLDFITPYERPWRSVEIRRHRLWLPPLIEPRKAYSLPPVPDGYDSLKMYKYVTNTHCISGMPMCYDSVAISDEQKMRFKAGLTVLLKDELKGRSQISQSIDFFLPQLADLVVCLFGEEFPHLRDAQIGNMVRYESFLERGGFGHLYEDFADGVKTQRISCDSVYKLGELAFCFRDTANVQLRSTLSIPPFVSNEDALCHADVEPFTYSPSSYVPLADANPLWMVPGFELGDPNDFGHLMINSMKNCREIVEKKWKAEPEEFNECLLAMATSGCFSWLNGQAHFKGFNQYNDVTYPFMTQAIFSDGRSWYFACYQLNTLDLMHNFQFENFPNLSSPKTKTNLCWFDGPHDLYEKFDPETNQFLNVSDSVLEKILKFFFLKPDERPEVGHFTPYVKKIQKFDNTDEELIRKNVEEQSDIKYTV